MKAYCDTCYKVTRFKNIKEPETIRVRGLDVTVDSSFYRCKCGYELNDPNFDVLEKAYEKRKTMRKTFLLDFT